MGSIVLLDDLTINKIAAGEVIERPANVVKELVENSIDSGANNIIIEIKKGGKELIKVIDNGKGIEKDDILIAFERHATSKIRKIEDLENIYSMGFRGEALASIVSISKLTMISKTKESLLGNKIVIQADKVLEIEEVGAGVGTTICIEKLFFNTPVRYKFLKQDSTETKYIKEWIEKASLINTNISFKLINDGKTIFSSNGDGNIENTIYSIYGKQIKKNLQKVNYQEENIKVTGVIGNTIIARETRKDQIIFLNKRYIKNSVLTSAADQAFKGATSINKYGFFILNVEMTPQNYDVNVHPTKTEVRFNDENKIYKILYHAIKEAMLNTEFLGDLQETNKDKYIESEFKFLTNNNIKNNEKNLQMIEKETNNLELIKRKEKRKIEYKYIGILFRTFIVIEIKDEIYLIDQHAGHERVLYEQIKANYKDKAEANCQMMLIPEIYNLSHKEINFLKENMILIKNVGFNVEFFGENTIKISGLPDLEYKSKTKTIFLDILDEMILNERTSIKDIEERFIATVACKAAVKANMDLNINEVDNLIQDLLNLNNPYTCPHGRPTTINISKDYIEKQIKM